MTNTLRRALLSLCALVALSTAPAHAATTWTFTGTCLDCPGLGTGTLTATPVGNFTAFSFTYTSDWITYTMSSPVLSVGEVPFSGSGFTYSPGQSLYLIQSGVNITSFGGPGNPLAAGVHTPQDTYFALQPSGSWSTGGMFQFDFGNNGSLTLQSGNSAVPEPSTLALTGFGALALGCYRRRRRP